MAPSTSEFLSRLYAALDAAGCEESKRALRKELAKRSYAAETLKNVFYEEVRIRRSKDDGYHTAYNPATYSTYSSPADISELSESLDGISVSGRNTGAMGTTYLCDLDNDTGRRDPNNPTKFLDPNNTTALCDQNNTTSLCDPNNSTALRESNSSPSLFEKFFFGK